jgi:hypothetical protein
VDGLRPSRRAIARIDSPPARATAISSRSENVRQRPFRSRPRRERTPPAATSQRAPFLRYVPASAAASVMNSPRCVAAQNRCTTSVTIRSENLAIDASVHPATIDELLPKSHPRSSDRTARRSPRAPRPRARLRDDRGATQPPRADDSGSPSICGVLRPLREPKLGHSDGRQSREQRCDGVNKRSFVGGRSSGPTPGRCYWSRSVTRATCRPRMATR